MEDCNRNLYITVVQFSQTIPSRITHHCSHKGLSGIEFPRYGSGRTT